MTKKVVLGQTLCSGVPVYVEEEPVDTLALKESDVFNVNLRVAEVDLELGLTDIRALRNLLNKAERQILLRHEQALKSRNLSLDL